MITIASRRITAGAVLVFTAVCVAACGSAAASGASGAAAAAPTASPSPSLGSAASGAITVTGAHIPQPASADVAVAYFTLTDTGPRADVLMSASTDPRSQASVMREVSSGANAESMVDVVGGLPVPAHGSVSLAPGGYHLMLTHPAARLVAGDHVAITLVLRDAGAIHVSVPVTPLIPATQNTAMSSTSGM